MLQGPPMTSHSPVGIVQTIANAQLQRRAPARGSVIRSANRRAGSSSAPRVPASTSSRSGSHESPPRTDGGYAAEAALVLRLKSAGYVLGGIKASGGARPRTDDRENNGRGSVSVGVTRPRARGPGRDDQTRVGWIAPRLLVMRRTTSSKSASS